LPEKGKGSEKRERVRERGECVCVIVTATGLLTLLAATALRVRASLAGYLNGLPIICTSADGSIWVVEVKKIHSYQAT
jgi:hypothetical protein